MTTHIIFDHPIISDLPQKILDNLIEAKDSYFKRAVVDAMALTERWDVLVATIHVFRHKGNTLSIEALPNPDDFHHVFTGIESTFVEACVECFATYGTPGQHPLNECKLGTVDTVLNG